MPIYHPEMAAKNTGLPYERIVQSIFQAILGQDRARNVVVEHDVKLMGKSGEQHQIDVYWEFEVGGVSYKTLVSAKDWAGNVKKEQVLSFKTILDDVAGQPRGIIVTREGYQSGAEGFGRHHGITLYVLRKPCWWFWRSRGCSPLCSRKCVPTSGSAATTRPSAGPSSGTMPLSARRIDRSSYR
jgi:hypothetical protein